MLHCPTEAKLSQEENFPVSQAVMSGTLALVSNLQTMVAARPILRVSLLLMISRALEYTRPASPR